MVDARRITQDEWYAALMRNDRTELEVLVKQHERWTQLSSDTAPRCLNRHGVTPEHVLIYMPAIAAYGPGHVYSTEGVQEATKSQTCEWCWEKNAAQLVAEGLISDDKKGE